MPSLPKRMVPSLDLESLVGAGLSAQEFRRRLQAVQSQDTANFREYSKVVETIVDGAIGLLRAGQPLDVSPLIESLAADERAAEERRKASAKQFASALRLVAKSAPHLLKIINEVQSAEMDSIAREAELHRDARWQLMQARARWQPSEGIGPIRGHATALDDLLKS